MVVRGGVAAERREAVGERGGEREWRGMGWARDGERHNKTNRTEGGGGGEGWRGDVGERGVVTAGGACYSQECGHVVQAGAMAHRKGERRRLRWRVVVVVVVVVVVP